MTTFDLFDSSGAPHSADGAGLLEGLNEPQRKAVEYRGPALLIVAGAGSGKTRVLTHRIAHLMRNKEAWPSQILAITFTNKAAAEMRERVEQLLGGAAEGMWISTFHSACVRILRKESERFGYVSGFTIYDSGDSRALLKRIIKDLEADTYGFTPANTSAKISRLKNELTDVDAYAASANEADPRERLFVEIFRAYENELRRAHAFDFDDLIGQVVHLFRTFPEIAAIYQRKFRHILVDEYQDTNHAQYSLIKELTRPVSAEQLEKAGINPHPAELDSAGGIPAASLTVVGDSDQSIYAFRGADMRNIVEFERDFGGAEVILLEQNYRSTQNILSAANAVIGNNFDRQEKNLWTDTGDGAKIVGFTGYSQHDEARFVAEEIEALHARGVSYDEIAVFYRTNAQTRALEELLIRSAVPYRVLGGTKFYERAEIKDAIAYLTTIVNPFDEYALRRILNTPKRGIGPMTDAQIAQFAKSHSISFRDAMREVEALGFGPKIKSAITSLVNLLDRATLMAQSNEEKRPAPVGEILQLIYEETNYVKLLRDSRDPQDEARAENLEELLSVAKDFDKQNPDGTLVDFLTEVSLVAAVDDLDDTSGTVSLMTLHTAKGLEYRAVFITGVEEGLIPHQMSFDDPGGPAEERRLFYVGITRAREVLHISLASTRAQFGDINVALPSRFLQEIPADLIDWRQSPGEVTSAGGTAPRALNSRGFGTGPSNRAGGGFGGSSAGGYAGEDRASGNMQSSLEAWRERKRKAKESGAQAAFPNTILGSVRDNGDMQIEDGDRIKHDEFGEGTVQKVTGEGSKRIAHVRFDNFGDKKLLIKIAPIAKLENLS